MAKSKSILSSPPAMDMAKMPKRISIREAEGGYIVSEDMMMGKDKVYDDLDGLHACIDETFGKGKKKYKDKE